MLYKGVFRVKGDNDGLVILAQDPSFSKLAFSLYDGKGNIFIDNCKFSLGDCVGFEKVFNANISIWEQYRSKLENDYGVNKSIWVKKVFSEIPPPTGMFSAGLYSLDTFILDRLFDFNSRCDEVWTLPPSFLMTIHNTRSYKKGDSTVLAKYLINDVLGDRFSYNFSGVLNADRAESFFFLLRAFVKYDIRESRDLIINAISGFFSESEKLLIKRDIVV
jgi:hypothetical protein